eukprot:scaffold1996_cov377-Prasinococcus_capsulatus_cf.AAC.6
MLGDSWFSTRSLNCAKRLQPADSDSASATSKYILRKSTLLPRGKSKMRHLKSPTTNASE